jgi:hypothetical protein
MPVAEVARDGGRRGRVQRADLAVGHLEDRRVRERRVVAVGLVLDHELPVGHHLVLQEAGRDLDLALRRVAAQRVDGRTRAAELFLQRLALGRQRTEHEALVDGHARHLGQAQRLALVGGVAGREGVAAQAAVVAEGPAMVVAGEAACVAAVLVAHPVATVRAAVVHQVDLAVAVACHQHRLGADGLHHEVVGLRHFADMADVDPHAVPDLLQFQLEDSASV